MSEANDRFQENMELREKIDALDTQERARLKEIKDSKEEADSSDDDGSELSEIASQRVEAEKQIRKNIRKRLGISEIE